MTASDATPVKVATPINSSTMDDAILITTTLPTQPLPQSSTRIAFETERLILRPFVADDIAAIHILRTQPEVMIFTATGVVDKDIAATQSKLDLYLPPNDTKTFNCAVCWRETGELIGMGGCHMFSGSWGWPELGYMFMKEHWGKGLATEFVRGFFELYSMLPRSQIKLKVSKSSLKGLNPTSGTVGDEDAVYEEQLSALIDSSNTRSSRVLEKPGFEHFIDFKEIDCRDPEGKLEVDLAGFRYFPGRHGAPASASS